MNTTLRSIDEVSVIEISGDIDGSNAATVQEYVLGTLKDGGPVILDLSAVPYMSSAGLRMLLSTYRQVMSRGGKLICVGVVDEIKDTMSVTGFIKFFALTDTINDALVSLDLRR